MERLKFYHAAFLILLFFAFIVPAGAQETDTTGSTGTNTTDTNTNPEQPKPPLPPMVLPTPEETNTPQVLPPPSLPPANIFISGIVMKEDGTPPPFGATIEMDCGSSLTRQASVGSDGYFSFQVEGTKSLGGVMPDASTRYGSDEFHTIAGYDDASDISVGYSPGSARAPIAIRLMGCDMRAQLPGYRSSILRVKEVLQPGQNDLGAIVVYPLERMQGTTVSATSLLAPKDARKLLKQAKKALKKKKFEEAEVPLKSAIAAYPNFGEAWFELGQLYKLQHRDEEAEAAYLKAIEADPLYVNPYIGLSWLLCIDQKWQKAAYYSDRALNLDPLTFPEAHFLNALANFNVNSTDVAEKSAKRYQRLDPEYRFPQVFLILSHIYAMRDDDERSIEEMRNYLRYAPDAPDAEKIRSVLREKLAKAAVD